MSRVRVVAFTVLGTSACTLLNPLDYLQGAREGGLDSGIADGSTDARMLTSDADAIDGGPGCPPERWASCGVTYVASDVLVSAVGGETDQHAVLWGDAERRTILRSVCDPDCTPPQAVVEVREPPSQLGASSNFVYWTTPGQALWRSLTPFPDGGARPIETLASLTPPSALVVSFPFVAWADATGVSSVPVGSSYVERVDNGPATAVAFTNRELFFVAGGRLYACARSVGTPCDGGRRSVDAGGVVDLLTYAAGFATSTFPLDTRGGVIVTVPHDGGTSVTVADIHEDAGLVPELADEPTPIVAISGNKDDVYFTTISGELRRRSRGSPGVVIVLRGLGPRTLLAADDRQVFVGNPAARQLLRVPR